MTIAIRSNASCSAALVRLLDDPLPDDADLADHQEAHVADDVVGELGVTDVVAVDIEAELLALQAAAIREIDLEIEDDTLVARGLSGCILLRLP